jgi:hypothetical protein
MSTGRSSIRSSAMSTGRELDSLVCEVCALSEARRLDGDSGETADPLGEPRMIELLFAAETDASLRPELSASC